MVAGQTPATSGITVAGEGEAKGQPDVAYITVGVETMKPTAKEAQAENARQMEAVIARLKSLGVADKDMRTSGLSLYPMSEKPVVVTGYRASNQVQVTVQDIARTGEVMDAAVEAVANTSGQIQLGFKDDSKMRLEALELAVKAAREKADAIAKGLGVRIIGVESATEEYSYTPGPRYAEAAKALGVATTPVMPGELTVTAQVKIVYRFQ